MVKSIIWTSIFILLLIELFVVLILVIPLPRTIRNGIAKFVTRFHIGRRLDKYVAFLTVALILALMESIITNASLQQSNHGGGGGDMWWSGSGNIIASENTHKSESNQKRMFRAQRNMYLSGFTLTLLMVINRITDLLQECVELSDEVQRLKKASSSSTTNTSTSATNAATNVGGSNVVIDGTTGNKHHDANSIEMKPLGMKKKE